MIVPYRIPHERVPKIVAAGLCGAVAGRSDSAALHGEPTRRPSGAWAVGVAGSALLLGYLMASGGFGRLYGRGALQDWPTAVAYVGLVLLFVWRLLALFTAWLARKRSEIPLGTYLLPLYFVEVSGEGLVVYPTNRLSGVERTQTRAGSGASHLALTFEGGTRRLLRVPLSERADRVSARVESARQTAARLAAQREFAALGRLDPFMPLKKERWQPPVSRRLPPFPRLLRWPLLAAIVVGVLLGPTIWLVRNTASDDAAFAAAEVGDSEAVRRYLFFVRGRHVAEATALLPHKVLEEARQAGTVTALRDFIKQFPDDPLAADARQSIDGLFDGALSDYEAQAPTHDSDVVAVFGRLLRHQRTHGSPPAYVWFRPPASDRLTRMDRRMLRRGGTRVAPIAPHFTDAANERREKSISRLFAKGFEQVFPRDIFAVVHGGRLDEAKDTGASAALDVVYTLRPGDGFYEKTSSAGLPILASSPATRLYVALEVDFDVTLRWPGEPDALSFDLHVEPPDSFMVTSRAGRFLSSSSVGDTQVYDVMAAKAFDGLSAELGRQFFREGSAAYDALGSE